MKRIIFLLLLSLLSLTAMAQKLTVESFTVSPFDLDAKTNNENTKTGKVDPNGDPCALVKVLLAREGAVFLGDIVGEPKYQHSEYWVFLTKGAKRLEVRLDGYLPLTVHFADYGVNALEPMITYKMVIVLPQATASSLQPKEQFALFVINPQNARLMVDNKPVIVNEGAATVKLSTSENHRYNVACDGYEPQSGVLNLSAGPVTMNVNLQPMYCTVDFVSNPLQMELSVDGQVIGKTPISVSNILAGDHTATFKKPGYLTQTRSFVASNLSTQTVEVTAMKDNSPSDMTITNNANVSALPISDNTTDATAPSNILDLSDDSLNGHEYVDLGLPSGLLWATCNVGANKPEDIGYYFSWGDTSRKINCDFSATPYQTKQFDGDFSKLRFRKYLGSKSSPYKDRSAKKVDALKTVLDLEDDAAHVNWRGIWRMPTYAELKELITECVWTWTTLNNVKGYRVSSKRNNNFIFLPAGGWRIQSELHGYYKELQGCYWSSSLRESDPLDAHCLHFGEGGQSLTDFWRSEGLLVRPVCGPTGIMTQMRRNGET